MPDYDTRRLTGIVGIDIRVTKVEGKFKLSQNRSEADRARVIAALEASGRADDAALARLMAAGAAPQS
jgi:transcriptional regulator